MRYVVMKNVFVYLFEWLLCYFHTGSKTPTPTPTGERAILLLVLVHFVCYVWYCMTKTFIIPSEIILFWYFTPVTDTTLVYTTEGVPVDSTSIVMAIFGVLASLMILSSCYIICKYNTSYLAIWSKHLTLASYCIYSNLSVTLQRTG